MWTFSPVDILIWKHLLGYYGCFTVLVKVKITNIGSHTYIIWAHKVSSYTAHGDADAIHVFKSSFTGILLLHLNQIATTTTTTKGRQ